MKESRLFKSMAGSAFAALAMMCGASLTVSCSSDEVAGNGINNSGEEITFPIYLHTRQENEGATAKLVDFGDKQMLPEEMKAPAECRWYAPNGEEEILPKGWNDPLGEDDPAAGKPKRTRYAYNENTNFLEVLWKDGDSIGVKTTANAQNGVGTWTKLGLIAGDGRKTASFQGIASTVNGMAPTGTFQVTAVYPYSENGTYNFASQPGTVSSLGDYDVRVDNGTLINGTIKDIFFVSKISVLRIDRSFFDDEIRSFTIGHNQIKVSVSGAGIGNKLQGVCTANEQTIAGGISVNVPLNSSTGLPDSLAVYIAFAPINTTDPLFSVELEVEGNSQTYRKYEFYKSEFVAGRMYNLRHPGSDVSEQCIVFKDPVAEAICLQNFDKDLNGCISYREARSVTYLGQAFSGSDIQWFPEFKEFTGLTMVPANAFKNCLNLEEIEFPARVTKIGVNAFYGCSKLAGDIALPVCTTIGSNAFIYCTSLTSANFPVCTTIDGNAFAVCTSLSSADFPACTTIGVGAFNACTSLTSADFPVCTTIEDYAFSSTSLTTISFPKVTTIGGDAFAYCPSLTSADFPECTTINYSAFAECTSLTTISFPKVTTIGGNAFAYTSLTSADFPVCTTINYSAFAYSPSLTTISFPKVTTIGGNAFYECTSLTTISFPKVTTIGRDAFYVCTSLTSANFPLCTTIGFSAFYGCTSLTSADFPECTTIGSSAFYDCTSLTTINFPKVTSIGVNAFYDCPCGIPPLANP